MYDGKEYLIEKYAIAIIPGLKLINLKPFKRYSIKPLLLGASFGKEFPLIGTEQELHEILQVLGGADILQNKNFTFSKIRKLLEKNDYSIIHFSTHGFFSHNLNESFLVTYDKKLMMNDLDALINISNKGRKQPLELVVFSASETAQGNKRTAPLGLAGIVVKAGARSALGTLWNVNENQLCD